MITDTSTNDNKKYNGLKAYANVSEALSRPSNELYIENRPEGNGQPNHRKNVY